MAKKINSVKIAREQDDYPDLSFLGEYASHPDQHTIDRQTRGDMGSREHRYFNAGCGDPDYIEQDYIRMEAHNRGDWYMVGVYAVAEIVVNSTIHRIRSAGLWGIESDSDASYFASVEQESLADLREQLSELGFKANQLDKAFASLATTE